MKKIAKNLCVWAMSMVAAGMFSSCDNGPEPTFPSVTLNNQIWYEELITDIKSVAYDEQDGVYTFYLSPTEGLTTIQGFTKANDYVAIQTNNINGVQSIEDNFAIDYKNVSISSIAMSKNVKEWRLDVVRNTDGTVAINAAGAMVTGDKVMAKYNGPCPEAIFDPGLENEFFYRAKKEAIKTVLYYEEPEGVFTYYLSTTEGLTTIQQMLEDDKYFKIVTDANNAWTSMAYKETDVEKSSDKVKKAEFTLTNQDGTMNLDMSVRLKSGLRMLAKYTGPCSEALYYPELENQCQNDRNIMTIGSIVVEHNFATNETTYNIYEETDVTVVDETKTLVAKVTAPLGADITSVNLAETETVSMTVGGATPVSGTLAWEVLTDRVTGVVTGISVTLDGRDENDRVIRVEYEGDYVTTGKSSKENNFTTNPGTENVAVLSKVFFEEGTGSYRFVFGTNAEANSPSDLMAENHFAAEITIAASVINKEVDFFTIDLADKTNGFKVYDYTKFTKWDNSRTYAVSQADVKSGTLKIAKVDNVFCWELTADLGVNENTSCAMTMSSDWCGVVTETSIPDITPSAPISNMFQILDTDGATLYGGNYREITSVQVAKVVNETASGSTYAADYYYFYLVNNSDVNDRNVTPRLRIRKEYLGKEINIATEAEALLAIEEKGYPSYGQTAEQLADIATAATTSWELYYGNYSFNYNKFGNPAPRSFSSAWPAVGTIKVDFDEITKKATIKLKVQNVTYSFDYSTGKHALGKSYSDNKRWFEVSFDGTCVKYEGKDGSSGFSASSSSDSMTW